MKFSVRTDQPQMTKADTHLRVSGPQVPDLPVGLCDRQREQRGSNLLQPGLHGATASLVEYREVV